MKKKVIVSLVCLNALLLVMVIWLNMPQAKAQAFGGATDYLVTSGRYTGSAGDEAIFVTDLGRRLTLAWRYDRVAKKFRVFPGRDLKTDFRAGAGGEETP